MKAVRLYQKGDLRIDDVAEPECGENDVIVSVRYAGICGSDIGYWQQGATGTALLREPMILGHEISGVVTSAGGSVHSVEIGQRVAIHPATIRQNGRIVPADSIPRSNILPEVRYLGSAASLPHEQGGMCERKRVRSDQVRALPDDVPLNSGALAEPLGVAMHAIRRAGDVRGKTALVNGCGPIGCLAVAGLKRCGARRVYAADISNRMLDHAQAMGADRVIDRARGEGLPPDVDVAIEASGVPAVIGDVLATVKRGEVLVQVGSVPARDAPSNLGHLITREIDYRGSYRFVDEISDAIEAMAEGLDVSSVITHEFPIERAGEAFAVAADRSTGSAKVLIRL